jgi:peptidoglycan hydrolase-like protein with peptidoglycan-binding domain
MVAAVASRSPSASRSTRSSYKPAPTLAKAQTPNNSLKKGMSGQSVSQLQTELNAAGAKLEVDGKFGPKTDAAVRAYQANHGLKVDGLAGKNTIGSLTSDGRGRDAYSQGQGTSATGTTKAPRAGEQGRAQGGIKAGDLQTPMNPRAPRNAPGTQAVNDNQDKGGPANKTATFDKITKAGQRNQMATGRITVNGNTYDFRSGGFGRGNLPKGDYKVTAHRWSRGDRSMNVGGVGYSFAMSNKYDARVGGTRSLLRIHPDGGSKGTMGCVGIVGNASVQRQFREDMRAELARNGGSFNLRVG